MINAYLNQMTSSVVKSVETLNSLEETQKVVEEKMEKIHESQSFIPIPFLKDQCEKTGDMEIEERSLSSTEVLGG